MCLCLCSVPILGSLCGCICVVTVCLSASCLYVCIYMHSARSKEVTSVHMCALLCVVAVQCGCVCILDVVFVVSVCVLSFCVCAFCGVGLIGRDFSVVARSTVITLRAFCGLTCVWFLMCLLICLFVEFISSVRCPHYLV